MAIVKDGNYLRTFGSYLFNQETDPDALAFINMLQVESALSTLQISQIDLLVKRLKVIRDVGQSTNLWSRCRAIYPYVGGTAYKCKFNLKDPRDLDAAFRLTNVGAGSPTFTSNGVQYSTTFCYNTHITPATHFTGQTHQGGGFLTCKVNRQSDNHECGSTGTTSTINQAFNFRPRSTGDAAAFRCYQGGPTLTASSDSIGRWVFTRPTFRDYYIFKNGIQFDKTFGTNAGSKPTTEMLLGGRNNNGTTQFVGAQRHGMAGFFEYCTPAEAMELDSAILAFETALSKT